MVLKKERPKTLQLPIVGTSFQILAKILDWGATEWKGLTISSVVTINRRVEQSVGLGRNSDQSTSEMDNRFLPIIVCPLLCGHVPHMATHEHNKTVKQTKKQQLLPS